MHRLLTRLDQLSERVGDVCAWMVFLMMIGTTVVVFLRYFLNVGSIPLQEAILYLHGAVIMLGIGFTLKRGACQSRYSPPLTEPQTSKTH